MTAAESVRPNRFITIYSDRLDSRLKHAEMTASGFPKNPTEAD